MPRASDIRVREVEVRKERVAYRTPLKFGGVPTTHATVVTVRLRIEGLGRREVWGSGSMPLTVLEHRVNDWIATQRG